MNKSTVVRFFQTLFLESDVIIDKKIEISYRDILTKTDKKKTVTTDICLNQTDRAQTFIVFSDHKGFTKTKKQLDQYYLREHFINNDINFVRIPFFYSISAKFVENIMKVTLPEEFKSDQTFSGFCRGIVDKVPEIEAPSGFFGNDVRPSDFNILGWRMFFLDFEKLIDNDMSDHALMVFESLKLNDNELSPAWFPWCYDKSPDQFVKLAEKSLF